MNAKIARLEALLADGWDVEDMASDDRGFAVLIRRGSRRATLTFDRADAWDVLYGDAFGSSRRHHSEMLAHP